MLFHHAFATQHNTKKKNYLQLSTNTINNSENILFIHFRSPFAHILNVYYILLWFILHLHATCYLICIWLLCSALDYKIKQLCAVFNVNFWRTYFHRTCNFFFRKSKKKMAAFVFCNASNIFYDKFGIECVTYTLTWTIMCYKFHATLVALTDPCVSFVRSNFKLLYNRSIFRENHNTWLLSCEPFNYWWSHMVHVKCILSWIRCMANDNWM